MSEDWVAISTGAPEVSRRAHSRRIPGSRSGGMWIRLNRAMIAATGPCTRVRAASSSTNLR